MTKDILIKISGLHIGEPDPNIDGDNEPIEVTAPGLYYNKNGKHYVLYDEFVEGVEGAIKNTVKFREDESLEIIKSGITNSHMVFENGKINVSNYQTPYGDLLVGTYTKVFKSQVEEDRIFVHVEYELEINEEKVADCDINMEIVPVEK